MNFPKVEVKLVKEGDFLIVRYMPMYQNRGIVATRIIEVYVGGFDYQNLPMGVQGSFDDILEKMKEIGLTVDKLLVGLPQGFQPPLENNLVHRVGGIYIPKSQRELLAQLSQDKSYRKSLQGLENPKRIMDQKELEEIVLRQ